jgi:protein-S-isoprenylcysteine O-methyltransferase Ste14
MHIVDYVILGGWVAFWLYWLAASRGVKAGQSAWGRFAGARLGVLLVVLLLVRTRVFKGHVATTDPWLGGIGLAIFVLGLGLAVWARIFLGRNWGMPMTRKEDPELVTTGPYHWVRHPIYTGMIFGMVGTAIAVSWFWVIAAAVMGGYFIYSAIIEERSMESLFPDTYPEYKASTKMLIPFVF